MNILDLQREFKHYALVQRGMRPRTLRDIVRLVSDLAGLAGTNRLKRLRCAQIKCFFDHGCQERDWSPKTYRLYWQYLKTFFDWCVRNRYLKRNPVVGIDRPCLPKRLPRCLSHEEAKNILFQASTLNWYTEWEMYRNGAIIATFLMAGLRLQELLSLPKTNVYLSAEEFFVARGKGAKDRVVPLHPRLIRILQRYLAESDRLGKHSPWMFHSTRSEKQLQPKDVRAVCKKITCSAGIKFTPHMLRHTFAREMLDSGLDIFKLKEILGHSSVATTQIYASVSRRPLKESVTQLTIY